uniref:Plastid lipid-associated protein/fibrillin conserved domain-containing protein n=1 Tax=Rhodosorus marinus TaxID=101924 RepID=A0A7S0G6A7_9RHOD|mmetsp:Transcript_2552/g.3745  ORF Transcript_2552/g.3745 Transcript_2552/m.3745 type:complete len:377 (+) Transcript_2552:492-1622(+)
MECFVCGWDVVGGRKRLAEVKCPVPDIWVRKREAVVVRSDFDFSDRYSYLNRENGDGDEEENRSSSETEADSAEEEPAMDSVDVAQKKFELAAESVKDQLQTGAQNVKESVKDAAGEVAEAVETGTRNVRDATKDAVRSAEGVSDAVVSDVKKSVEQVFEDINPFRREEDFINLSPKEGSTEQLKRDLVLAALGTNRGFAATADQTYEIRSIISSLESKNPTPVPNESEKLEGDWKLIYTNALDILALGVIPLVQLGQVYQNIKMLSDKIEVENLAILEPSSAPVLNRFGARTSLEVSVKATAEVDGDNILNIKFENQKFSPQSLLGRDVLGKLPALELGLRGVAAGYIETSYLDEEMRIAKSIGNNIFVLIRERS